MELNVVEVSVWILKHSSREGEKMVESGPTYALVLHSVMC